MKKKLLVLLTLFAFMPFVNAEEYLVVDRDTQSNGVETVSAGEDGSYELFYNAETGKFQVVYNITTEAPDEITLDLTNSLRLLYEIVDGTLAENEKVQTALNATPAENYVNITKDSIEYKIDLKTLKSKIYVFPGDRIAFVVTVKNNSGKAYVYKEDSLVIASPKQPENESDVVGFDGQTIDKSLTSNRLYYGYNENLDDHNIINELIDRALKIYCPEESRKLGDSSKIYKAFVSYIVDYYDGDDEKAMVELFNEKYNTNYSVINDFSRDDFYTLTHEIGYTYTRSVGFIEKGSSFKYDVYYNNDLSAVITSEEEYDKAYKNEPEWSTRTDGAITIGKYMSEKNNNIDNGKYKETDSFLNETVGELKNNESSSFVYGFNIDGQTNNNYENYSFSLYSSFKMVARKGVVIINYIDENGKPLKESETVEYYYYEDYETKAASFEDYELIEVEGLEKGTIEQDETVVTYIYQFTSGQGNDEPEEEPKKELVQTGSEVDYSIMTSAFITISLIGLAIYTHKKQN